MFNMLMGVAAFGGILALGIIFDGAYRLMPSGFKAKVDEFLNK